MIIGIDPGTATTGYGIIKKNRSCKKNVSRFNFKCIDYGLIKTNPEHNVASRLHTIHKNLNKIIKKYKPTILAVERLFFFKNLKTAMPVSQAKGVILMTAAKKQLPVYEFTPLEMKMTIAGYGRANKKEVQKIIKSWLGLKEIPTPDDAADALGIAICCALKLTNLNINKLKKKKRSRLSK